MTSQAQRKNETLDLRMSNASNYRRKKSHLSPAELVTDQNHPSIRFRLARLDGPRHVLVTVDVRKLDCAWRKISECYIGWDGQGAHASRGYLLQVFMCIVPGGPVREDKMNMPEESIEEMLARNQACAHEYNCETLMGKGALHVAPKFAPHILAVLNALPLDVTEKLMDLKVAFLAVDESIRGLDLDLPATLHAHPISGSHPNMHAHPGGKVLYFSPLLLNAPQEEIRFTIAHEIAHVVLCHTDDSPNARDTGERQERDADALAGQWGFKRPPTVPAA